MMKESYDHHSRYLTESNRFIWYINSKGYIHKITKSTNKETILNGYIKDSFKIIKIKSVECRLSHLIAEYFLKDYYPGCCVGYKDGNKLNCDVENLYIYSRIQHGKETGYLAKGMPVIIKRKNKATRYRSIREAAKSINVSYQTLQDYLEKKVKYGVIKDMGVKAYYELL